MESRSPSWSILLCEAFPSGLFGNIAGGSDTSGRPNLCQSSVVPMFSRDLPGVLLIVWVVPLKPHAQNGLLRRALQTWLLHAVAVLSMGSHQAWACA